MTWRSATSAARSVKQGSSCSTTTRGLPISWRSCIRGPGTPCGRKRSPERLGMLRVIAQEVRRRAGGRCEYCHFPEAYYPAPYEIDHVIALKHGGPTVLSNLALACLRCNGFKGPCIASLDPRTQK